MNELMSLFSVTVSAANDLSESHVLGVILGIYTQTTYILKGWGGIGEAGGWERKGEMREAGGMQEGMGEARFTKMIP